MSLPPGLRRLLIQQLVQAMGALPANEWEPLGDRLAEMLAGTPLRHRGQSAKGNPQGYAIDSYSPDGSIGAEYSTESGYFKTLEKPTADYQHVRELLPSATTVYLLSNQPATPQQQTSVLKWQVERGAEEGIQLLVLDAQTLAEFIVDEVIESDAAAEEISDYLEPLGRLRELYAASNLVPSLWRGTVSRPDLEERVRSVLTEHRVVLLAGMSGIGKSDTAAAVARARERPRGFTIWVPSIRIASVGDLRSVDVFRRGVRLNLLGELNTRPTLVILDDLQTDGNLEDVIDQIRDACGPDSEVIITSQIAVSRPFTIEVPLLGEAQARELLEYGVATCPEAEFRTIWKATGGHPLALRLLNGSVREGASWNDAAADALQVGNLPVREKAALLVDVILTRWRPIVEQALGFFIWCDSPRVHAGLFKATVGSAASQTLLSLGLVAVDQADTVRLHDIVWASLGSLNPPLQVSDQAFAQRLDAYVRSLASDDARTMLLNHVARLHQSLLSRLVSSGNALEGHIYAWLHYRPSGPASVGLLDAAAKRAETLIGGSPGEFQVQVAVELAEASVFAASKTAPSASVAEQDELLRPFNSLLSASGLSKAATVHIRHHRAKALKRLRRHEEAINELESLITWLGENHTPPASRLLLARILSELPRSVKVPGAGPRARGLLLNLLDETLESPTSASASVTLAAGELLRRHTLSLDVRSVLPKYIGLLEPLIISAGRRGLEQGVLTFAALSDAWRQTDEASFWRVYDSIPMASVEDIDDCNELEAWGEILESGAAQNKSNRRELLEEAVKFLSKCPSTYSQTHLADVLVQLGQAEEAIPILVRLLDGVERPTARAWPLFRLSAAYTATGDLEKALQAATDATSSLAKDNKHYPRFVEHEEGLRSQLSAQKDTSS